MLTFFCAASLLSYACISLFPFANVPIWYHLLYDGVKTFCSIFELEFKKFSNYSQNNIFISFQTRATM